LNGGFKEAKELKLTLPEDDPFMFELLMGYMFGGMGEVEFSKDPGESYDYCWEFIEYTEKYDVTDACIILEKEMAQLITEHEEGKFNMDKTEHKGNFVKPIFDYFPQFHELRTQMARVALSRCLVNPFSFKEELSVEGFAAQIFWEASRCPMIATAVKHIDGFLDTPKSYQERKAMDE
jgi:hypothetical protein